MSQSSERLGRNGWIVLGVLAAASVLFDLLRDWSDPTYVWDYPLFFVLVGLGGAALLTVLAKIILAALIDRPEDYYDRMVDAGAGRNGDDLSLEGAKKPKGSAAPEGGEPIGQAREDEVEEDPAEPASTAPGGGRA